MNVNVNVNMKPQAQGYVPSHPGVVEIVFGDGELDSGLVARKVSLHPEGVRTTWVT